MPFRQVRDDLKDLFLGLDPLKWAESAEGQTFRERDGRRTFRFHHSGKSYFAKLHSGVSASLALKELFSLRLPVTGAAREWKALGVLERSSVRAPVAAAFASTGRWPLRRRSLVIIEDVGTQRTLDDVANGLAPDDWRARRRWVASAGDVLFKLHAAGVNHRDFYPGHLLVPDESAGSFGLVPIDFHRAGTWDRVPERWIRKDLGAIAFGALPFGLSRTDRLRFVRAYAGSTRASVELRAHPRRWRAAEKRVQRLSAERARKGDAFGG